MSHLDELTSALEGKDYDAALKLFPLVELKIFDKTVQLSENEVIIFYFKYLASYIITSELNGAKYLWKRLPSAMKAESGPLALLWVIGKKLWISDTVGAFDSTSLLSSAHPVFANICVDIISGIRRKQYENIVKSFSTIHVKALSASINMSVDEAIVECQRLGWVINSDGYATVIGIVSANDHQYTDEQRINEYTNIASYMERKTVRVDIGGAKA